MCGWQVKLCDPLTNSLTRAISECFRDEALYNKALYKWTLLCFLLHPTPGETFDQICSTTPALALQINEIILCNLQLIKHEVYKRNEN